MIEKVKKTIAKHRMLDKGDTVLVGVSGGMDSIALLHCLYLMKDVLGLELVVCHLNHGLRGSESGRDYDFVKGVAKKLGLRFYGKTLRPGELKKKKGVSPQVAARGARLSFFESAAGRFRARRAALGHTMDDQAETVLMRLVKGSALGGLSGIPPVRGIYIRPLIGVKREEVARFIGDEGLDYVVDSTNLRTDYLRNDVRINLMPFIVKRYNPAAIETLAHTADTLRHDDDFIEGIAAFLGAVIKITKTRVEMDRARLLDLHTALGSRVFLKAAEILGRRADVYGPHVDSFLDMVRGSNPSASIDLPGSLYLAREYDLVTLFTRRPAGPAKPFEKRLAVPGTTTVKETGALFRATFLKTPPRSFDNKTTAYFDYDSLPGPLSIRQARPGDRMVPLGMKGHRKLKEIFIDEKVPRRRRPGIPVLCSGEEVIWAVGVRVSELCKIRATTKKILKIEAKGVKT